MDSDEEQAPEPSPTNIRGHVRLALISVLDGLVEFAARILAILFAIPEDNDRKLRETTDFAASIVNYVFVELVYQFIQAKVGTTFEWWPDLGLTILGVMLAFFLIAYGFRISMVFVGFLRPIFWPEVHGSRFGSRPELVSWLLSRAVFIVFIVVMNLVTWSLTQSLLEVAKAQLPAVISDDPIVPRPAEPPHFPSCRNDICIA